MLDGNPLPGICFIVTPDPAASPDQMQAIYKDITKLRASNQQLWMEWVQTLYRINEFIRRFCGSIVTLGMAFVLVAHSHHPACKSSTARRGWKSPSCWVPLHFIRRLSFIRQCGVTFSPPPSKAGLSAWLSARSTAAGGRAIFKPYGLNIGWRFSSFSEVSLVFGFVIAGHIRRMAGYRNTS